MFGPANCSPNHLIEPLECLKKSGPIIESKENEMTIKGAEEILPINLVTEPYPGFPTDLQAQFMILALLANGKSTFHETSRNILSEMGPYRDSISLKKKSLIGSLYRLGGSIRFGYCVIPCFGGLCEERLPCFNANVKGFVFNCKF